MLSKLFAHIKIGSGIWLMLCVALVVGLNFQLSNFYNVDQNNFPKWVVFSVSGAAITVLAFGMMKLFNNGYQITRKNYYTGLIIAIIWGIVPHLYNIKVSLSLVLLLLLYINLSKISDYHKANAYPYLINAGAIAFFALLLSPLGWVFLLLTLVNNFLYAKVSLRDILLPIYTFLMCTAIALGIGIVINEPYFLMHVWHQSKPELFINQKLEPHYLTYAVLSGLFLVSLKEYFIALGKAPVVKRKAMSLLVIHFILFIVGALLFQKFETYFLGGALFALAVLLANHLQYTKKFWVREIWIWLLILLNALPLISA